MLVWLRRFRAAPPALYGLSPPMVERAVPKEGEAYGAGERGGAVIRPDVEAAKLTARERLMDDRDNAEDADCYCSDCNLSRAYLALLETVAPLLAAAEMVAPGEWRVEDGIVWAVVTKNHERRVMTRYHPEDAHFIATARNTADALRDLLTGGEA